MPDNKEEKLHCPYCDHDIPCEIKAQEKINRGGDEYDTYGEITYMIAKCKTCQGMFTVIKDIDFDFFQYDKDGNEEPEIHWQYLPEAASAKNPNYRLNDEIYKALVSGNKNRLYIKDIYRQISDAMNKGQGILAALGMRSLIDACCIDNAGGNLQDGFARHLTQLKDAEKLSRQDYDIIKEILDIGHGATHRLEIPEMNNLKICMKAIERLLDGLYVQPKRYKALKERKQ